MASPRSVTGWKGIQFPVYFFKSIKEELIRVMGLGPTATLGEHFDDIKQANQPDVVSFKATGGPQVVTHGLGVVPQHVCISSFAGPATDPLYPSATFCRVTAMSAGDITIDSVKGSDFTLLLFPPCKYR